MPDWRRILVSGKVLYTDLAGEGTHGQFLGISSGALSWSNPLTASGDTNFTRLGIADDTKASVDVKYVTDRKLTNAPTLEENPDWQDFGGNLSTFADDLANTISEGANYEVSLGAIARGYDAVFAHYDSEDPYDIQPHGLLTGDAIIHDNFATTL